MVKFRLSVFWVFLFHANFLLLWSSCFHSKAGKGSGDFAHSCCIFHLCCRQCSILGLIFVSWLQQIVTDKLNIYLWAQMCWKLEKQKREAGYALLYFIFSFWWEWCSIYRWDLEAILFSIFKQLVLTASPELTVEVGCGKMKGKKEKIKCNSRAAGLLKMSPRIALHT